MPVHEFGKEADVIEILTRLERVSAEAQLLRELFVQKDERISQMTSELGELRAMMVRAESENQDKTVKIEKLNSTLKTLDPMEIEKTLAMKEKMIVEAQAGVEKLEKMLEDLRTNYVELAAKINELGNFESISKVYKDVDEALSSVKRKENNINLIGGKVETTFFEMEKRLKEFEKAKPLIERAEDMSGEMIKNLSDISIKMNNLAPREEVEEFRENITKELRGVRKASEEWGSKATEDIKGIKESMAEISKEAAGLKGLQSVLGDNIKNVGDDTKDVQEKITEEIGEIKVTLAEMAPRIEQLPENVRESKKTLQDSKGVQEAVRQDFEVLKTQQEEKLSHISTSVDSLREQSLEAAERMNEVSPSMAKMENEIHKMANQVDEYSQKSVKTEGRMSSFEELVRGVNDSLSVLSEKMDAVKKSIRTDMGDLKNEQRQFENNIDIRVSQIKEATDKSTENLANWNEHFPLIMEAMNELVSTIEVMEKSGKKGVIASLEKVKEIKWILSDIIKRIRE